MKAMVLAAGLGTRLRPLTENRPKALIEVAGRTLLEITLIRLREFGAGEVIINVHYLADMVLDYLKAKNNFGMHIEISREESLLDTGGGLKKAAYFFLKNAATPTQPFILHNVDVISTIDLGRMVRHHGETGALATLAVENRKTRRYLLFDEALELCGRRSDSEDKVELVRPGKRSEPLAFCGIHVISPELLLKIEEDRAFSIIDVYLRLASAGEKISGFRTDAYYWRDLGKPQNLDEAARDFRHKWH